MAKQGGYPTLKKVLSVAGITGRDVRDACGLKKIDTVYDRLNGKQGRFDLVEMVDIHRLIKRVTGVDLEIGTLFDLDQDDREEMQNDAETLINSWHYLARRWDVDPHWGW